MNNKSKKNLSVEEHSMAQAVRDHDHHAQQHGNTSSIREISIIETMESFLEENGAQEVDQKVLRRMAEALTKRLNDTSPGTLQDVTMDNSYAVAGYRSLSGSLQPNNFHGTASPSTQGRSVREFEEQLSALRKENFNLKLKLYFMEETLPGYQQAAMSGSDGGPEALAKQIIDSKVEIEMLRKDCKEKQDLLKDAAQAITHLEDLQKQTEEKFQTVVDELKQKINFMEMERELERSQSNVDVHNELTNSQNAAASNELGENINAMQKIGELESIIRDHEEQIEDFNTQITKLDEILVERDATISECNTKIKTLEFQNAELMESLERKNKDLNDAELELAEMRKKYNQLKLDYKEILNDYKLIKEEYKKRMLAMKNTERVIELQQEKILEMETAVKAKKNMAENKIALLSEYDSMLRKFNNKRNQAAGAAFAGCASTSSNAAATATTACPAAAAGVGGGNATTTGEPRENRFFRTIMNKLESNRKVPGVLATTSSTSGCSANMANNAATASASSSSTHQQHPNSAATSGGVVGATGGSSSATTAAGGKTTTSSSTPRKSSGGDTNCTKNKLQTLNVHMPNVSLFKPAVVGAPGATHATVAATTLASANPYNYALEAYNKISLNCTLNEDDDHYLCGLGGNLSTSSSSSSTNYSTTSSPIYECIDHNHEYFGIRPMDSSGHGGAAAAMKLDYSVANDHCRRCGEQFALKKSPIQLTAALAAYDNLLARKFLNNPKLAQHFLKLHALKLQSFAGAKAAKTAINGGMDAYKPAAAATAAALSVRATLQQVANEIELKSKQDFKQHPIKHSIESKSNLLNLSHVSLQQAQAQARRRATEQFLSSEHLQQQQQRQREHVAWHAEIIEKPPKELENLQHLGPQPQQRQQPPPALPPPPQSQLQPQAHTSPLRPHHPHLQAGAAGLRLNEHLRKELQDLKAQLADKLCILDETEEKLKHRTEVYEKALRTIQKLMLNIGNQQKEIAQLKSNQSCISAAALQNAANIANMTTASALSGGFEYTGNNGTTSLSGDTEAQHYAPPTQRDADADLRKQLLQAQNDAATADRWRRECADVCTVLTNRLEELAGFLNSLLKQKDVLGILAADRRRAIRKAVDRSLDLSKSLNMTLSFTGMSMADQSFAQLSNLSEILGYVEDEADAEELTFNSHIDLSRPSNELQKRDDSGKQQHRRSGDGKKERRSLPLQQEIQSESEAWSEPDRKVSMARIGLDENSASLSKELPAKLLAVAASSESECDMLNQSRNAKQRTHDRIVQLEQMIAQRDERILDTQSQLVDADNRLRQEHLLVLQLKQQIQELEAKIAENHDAEALLKELAERTDMLDKCRTELDELKLKHEIAIALAAEQLKEKLKQLRNEMEAQQQTCVDKLNEQHRAVLEHDYVALQQYDEIKTQLLELQRQYIEAQRTIDNLTDMEHELKQNLLDSELEARSLKKQLDESTLQASRAIMERTKACNDKLQLEQLVPHLKQQLAAHESERSHLQAQVVQLEEQLAEATTRLLLQCNKNSVNDATASGYTSEEVAATPNERNGKVSDNAAGSSRRSNVNSAQLRQHNTSSPDLGIESDAGRISSGEQSSAQQQRNSKLIELNISLQEHKTSIKAESSDEAVENIKPANASNKLEQQPQQPHDCAKVDLENAELRRKLLRTKKAFEDTYEKLRLANQKKAQIEKDIKNQILKTHNVLRNVRSNMENDL